jgi:hypothetical protein
LAVDKKLAQGLSALRTARVDCCAKADLKTEGHVSTKYLQRKYPLIYQQSLWIFGNWDNALRAAG